MNRIFYSKYFIEHVKLKTDHTLKKTIKFDHLANYRQYPRLIIFWYSTNENDKRRGLASNYRWVFVRFYLSYTVQSYLLENLNDVVLLGKLLNTGQLWNKPETMVFIWIDLRVTSGKYRKHGFLTMKPNLLFFHIGDEISWHLLCLI